ncbi:hypothetical protein A4G19_10110 [Pasteurellaceae bacterium Macca]|nr:hypothetical protein [Pasteurellaceae bacterium Macca]
MRPIDNEGKNDTVFRLIRLANNILDHAVNIGVIEFNPCHKVSSAFTLKSNKHQPSLPPEKLGEFLAALHHSNRDYITKMLVQWLLLTMVRTAEAVSVEWSEIDFEQAIWRIPAEKMKGRKNEKRQHDVPLSRQAMAILLQMKAINKGQKYVFPHYSKPNEAMCSQTPNNAIKRIANGRYKGLLTAHGLRSIASTYLNDTFTENPTL